ncbi:hypothetical protein ZWY2020_052083 [Hordeum vulgare]|nr:hypothetical protein ZWY2020_052083 [Hordeum vulgare]
MVSGNNCMERTQQHATTSTGNNNSKLGTATARRRHQQQAGARAEEAKGLRREGWDEALPPLGYRGSDTRVRLRRGDAAARALIGKARQQQQQRRSSMARQGGAAASARRGEPSEAWEEGARHRALGGCTGKADRGGSCWRSFGMGRPRARWWSVGAMGECCRCAARRGRRRDRAAAESS